MDVNRTFSISTVGSGGSKKEQKPNPKDGSKQNGKNFYDSPSEETEAFAVEGLLSGDLDPKFSKALERLACQLEPLRTEVELARCSEARFREISEQHSFLPLLGRREFSRELSLTLSHMKDLNSAALIVLHLVNGDQIRQRLGRDALDGALSHIAETIKSNLQPTDVVGNMGGNDFGLVLLARNKELAVNREEQLVDAITRQPFIWLAELITLEVVTGIAMLDGKMKSETALRVADQNLLHTLSA